MSDWRPFHPRVATLDIEAAFSASGVSHIKTPGGRLLFDPEASVMRTTRWRHRRVLWRHDAFGELVVVLTK
eukprot:10798191-Lingulodinium_polyedra.AAC.1